MRILVFYGIKFYGFNKRIGKSNFLGGLGEILNNFPTSQKKQPYKKLGKKL